MVPEDEPTYPLPASKATDCTWCCSPSQLAFLSSTLSIFKKEPFLAVPGLQTGTQTFSDVRRLTDIKKSLEKI